MNSCCISRMLERRNFLTMFCYDTLEKRVMNVICMKYPFLLIPGFIQTPHILREMCVRQYLYKTECNGEERLIYAITQFQHTEGFACYTVEERIRAIQTVINN